MPETSPTPDLQPAPQAPFDPDLAVADGPTIDVDGVGAEIEPAGQAPGPGIESAAP